MSKRCKVKMCYGDVKSFGLCQKHYVYARRHNTLEKIPRIIRPPSRIINSEIAEIGLSKGYIAIIDTEDFERISKFDWNTNINDKPRAYRTEGRDVIYMHQEIIGVKAGYEIDHKNGNSLDNRKANIWHATHSQNMQNTEIHKKKAGVCFNWRARSWLVYLDRPQGRKYLGYRKTREEALLLLEQAKRQCL